MKSLVKKVLLGLWDILTSFARWCETHGVFDMLLKVLIEVLFIWLVNNIT